MSVVEFNDWSSFLLTYSTQGTLRYGPFNGPSVGVRFIQMRLQSFDSRGTRIHRPPKFELDHVEEINIRYNDTLNGRTVEHFYDAFRPLIPKLQGHGIRINLHFSTLEDRGFAHGRIGSTMQLDCLDDKTTLLVAMMLHDIRELRIKVGKLQLRLQL